MAYPILHNCRDYVRALKEGRPIEAEDATKPSDVNVTEGHLRVLKTRLEDIRKEVEGEPGDRTAFDAPAAIALHRNLHINRAVGADKAFWCYLAAVELRDVVRWRWGADEPGEHPPGNRYRGGWKNTFQRLWFRAELARAAGTEEDPYGYVDIGGEDFWVGLLEREISECNDLVSELLQFWDEKEKSGEARMTKHRRFFIVLRLLRPSRMYEAMSVEEMRQLLERAFRISREDWVAEFTS